MKKILLVSFTFIALLFATNSANAQVGTAIKFAKYAWNAFSAYTTVDYASEAISDKTIKQHLEDGYYSFTEPDEGDAEDYGKGFAKGLGDAINGSGMCPSKSKAYIRGYNDGYSLGN